MKKITTILKISQIICSVIYMVLPFMPLYHIVSPGYGNDGVTDVTSDIYYSAYNNLDAYISSDTGKILLIGLLEALFTSTIVFLYLELAQKKFKVSELLFRISTVAIAVLLFACVFVTRA